MTVSDESEVQLQLYARAPAPSRDYYGLTITQTKIILNIWNISYGPHVYPKRHISSLEDFPDQRYMQHDIQRTFGDYALSFAKSFAAKELRLQCLPMKICNSEGVWRVLYKKKIKRRVMLSDIERGTEIGWKQALKMKILSKVTLRNLLDKNETNKKATTNKPMSNSLTSNTTPNVIFGKASDSKYDNYNTNNKTMKRIDEITQVDTMSGRFTRSAINLKKSTSSKIECNEPSKSCIRFKNKDESPQTEISFPINKSKLKNAKIELDGLMMGKTVGGGNIKNINVGTKKTGINLKK